MIVCCVTNNPVDLSKELRSSCHFYTTKGGEVVSAYHECFLNWEETDEFLCMVHDDLEIHENNWRDKLDAEFDDPDVAIVGMGGATGIGTYNLYRKPYRIEQLVRRNFYSNLTNWRDHGAHLEGARDVAVLDGFCMAFRTSWLRSIGGWKWIQSTMHCYDLAICLRAVEDGKRVRAVGISCTHQGGKTTCSPEYAQWCADRGSSPEKEHAEPHKWFADRFRNILPYEVKC